MKNLKSFLLLLVSIVVSTWVNAQEKKEDQVKRIVEAQNYVFIADMVNPQFHHHHGLINRGDRINLYNGYGLSRHG